MNSKDKQRKAVLAQQQAEGESGSSDDEVDEGDDEGDDGGDDHDDEEGAERNDSVASANRVGTRKRKGQDDSEYTVDSGIAASNPFALLEDDDYIPPSNPKRRR